MKCSFSKKHECDQPEEVECWHCIHYTWAWELYGPEYNKLISRLCKGKITEEECTAMREKAFDEAFEATWE